MILNLYSVFDSVALTHTDPFCSHSDDVAKRMFANSANDKASNISFTPSDFFLMRVGVWDNVQGTIITNPDGPETIVCASTLVRSE